MTAVVNSELIESEIERLRDLSFNRSDAVQIIRELGEIIGIEDLELDGDGVVELVIDDVVELSLIHLPDLPGIVAAATMPPSVQDKPRILRQLLNTNLSWQATQGGCFIYVEPRVALCRLVPVAPGGSAQLDHELAGFVGQVRQWQELLSEQVAADQSADSSSSDLNDSAGVRI